MGLFFKKKPPVPMENAKRVMALLGCPCEFIKGGKKVSELMVRYIDAAEQGRAEGFTPVLIVMSDTLFDIFDGYEEWEKLREEVMATEPFDVEKWFEERRKEDEELFCEENFEEADEALLNSDKLAQKAFLSVVNYGKNVTEDIVLAKIPTDKPWEIFSYIPFGGWNECPENGEIMRIAEYWHREYGAVPAVITSDNIEFYASPVSAEKAHKLAWEQFIFCPDIVLQGVGSVDALESSLKRSDVWYFWWD